jgi:class 3 adenylate cyclase
MNARMDVREILPLVRVPTIVLGRKDATLPKGGVDFPPMEEGIWVAERIPGAKLVELPGRDYLPWVGDQDALVDQVAEFVTGAAPAHETERVLLTVLFTDIAGSTELASKLGDRRWRDLLERHNEIVRARLEQFRGREIDRAGDGFLATFDGPARAVRCAQAVLAEAGEEGLTLRAGVHSGEVELLDEGIGGIAVHIGARVCAAAQPGEVLVTSTVRDLVAGSGIEFDDRGPTTLKGISEPRVLLAVGRDKPSP